MKGNEAIYYLTKAGLVYPTITECWTTDTIEVRCAACPDPVVKASIAFVTLHAPTSWLKHVVDLHNEIRVHTLDATPDDRPMIAWGG